MEEFNLVPFSMKSLKLVCRLDKNLCHSCSTENLHLDAVGYCQNCQEYLCDTCCKYHRKTTATRHHILLDKADMPKSRIAVKPTDDLEETCPKHQGKLLEYFCYSHIELCCIVCLNVVHGSCKVISHIPNVSGGIANTIEYNHLMTDLKALASKLTKQQGIIKLSTDDNDRYQSESIAGIRESREELGELLEKYEKNYVMKVSKHHFETSEQINAASSKCQVILSDLTATIAELREKKTGGKNNQLFVDIKLARQRLSAMEAEACDVTDCKITQYGSHQDDKINEMISTLSTVLSQSIRHDYDEINARYIGEVNVKADDARHACYIDGIVVLPGGNIVLTNFNNNSLELVDTKLNKVTSRLELSSKPLDITQIKPNQVAVSLGDEGKIELYTVTDVFSKSNTIHVEEKGFEGIDYTENRFILIYFEEGLVKIVDMSGRALSTISTDQNGDRLFDYPRHIAVGRGGDVAYVTDEAAHTVTTMTLSGLVISVYKNDELKEPGGITVGPDHKVYVCFNNSHTVLQLSSTGEFQQIVLDEQRGLSPYPYAIAYDDIRDRLYISSGSNDPGDCNYVKFFQID